jgi:dolichyl-phosphate beta-glucosyltransferase
VAPPRISVIAPVYNEEEWIASFIDQVREELQRLRVPWEIVVVDDGSTDSTTTVAAQAANLDNRVRLLRTDHRGKGAAVRRGLLEAHGAWRFVADVDLSMPIDNLKLFLAALNREPVPDLVIGSREAPGAERIGEPWLRHVVGRAFNALVQAVVLPGIEDTQCGYKLITANAASAICPHLTIEGFAFDVELLFLARRRGFTIQEVGITWRCRKASRVRLGNGAAAFLDIVRVRLNARLGRYRSLTVVARGRLVPRTDETK